MPPAVSESESASDGEEVIAPRPAKKRQPTPPPKEEDDEDEIQDEIQVAANNDDEADDDEDEVEYVVEKIVNHTEDGGMIKYEVKWQGYGHSENTWEPEENLDGAINMLQAYFKKIGGRPVFGSKANSSKKRGRKSAGATETPEPPKSKKTKTEFSGKRGRPAKNGSQDLEWPQMSNEEWTPPIPKKEAWEDLIVSIETIEADEHGKKWAYLLWAQEDSNGNKRTSKALLSSVHTAAPQLMLKFYEEHLVFKESGQKKQRAGGATVLSTFKDEEE